MLTPPSCPAAVIPHSAVIPFLSPKFSLVFRFLLPYNRKQEMPLNRLAFEKSNESGSLGMFLFPFPPEGKEN